MSLLAPLMNSALFRGRWFRWLLGTRITSQVADGVFQVALASHVLFSPERQPTARDVALVLAVVLLPFTVLGPFAGVFLDRWQRRQVLVVANLVRGLVVVALALLVHGGVPDRLFVGIVLLCLSVNRFVLAGLSASLPHTVLPEDLVAANALTPTLGSIAAVAGGLLGTLVRGFSSSDVVVLLLAALGYVAASLVALRIPRAQLGPDDSTERQAVRHVLVGLVHGLRHLRGRPVAARALAVIGASRLALSVLLVSGFLVFRNHLHAGDVEAALGDIGVLLALFGLGFVLAAAVTPAVSLSGPGWITTLLLVSVVAVVPFALYQRWSLWLAGLVLGFCAQGVKICVDTLVQLGVDDAFRGRVFALYDMLFNLAFVAAAAAAALVVPEDGQSLPVAALCALGFLGVALVYARGNARAAR